MNMRIESQLGQASVGNLTQVYDLDFFNRYRIETPIAPATESETTNVYVLAKNEIRQLKDHPAFDAFCRTNKSRLILDPLLCHLDYLEGQMHDIQANGAMAQQLNAAFDLAMESLVRADWPELMRNGADRNQVCLALKKGLGGLASMFAVEDEVASHMEEWFSFYRNNRMSLSQQREKRVKLNKIALDYHKNLAFTSMNRKNASNSEQVMGEIREQLNGVQKEIDDLGVDPDEQYVGAFTQAAQDRELEQDHTDRFFVSELYRNSLTKVNNAIDTDRKQKQMGQSLGAAPQPESKAYKSQWVLEPKQEQQEPKGFFGKMRSAAKKVAGWVGL